MVNLLISHYSLLENTYRIKIMFNGIAIIKQPKNPFILCFCPVTLYKMTSISCRYMLSLYEDIIRLNLIAS